MNEDQYTLAALRENFQHGSEDLVEWYLNLLNGPFLAACRDAVQNDPGADEFEWWKDDFFNSLIKLQPIPTIPYSVQSHQGRMGDFLIATVQCLLNPPPDVPSPTVDDIAELVTHLRNLGAKWVQHPPYGDAFLGMLACYLIQGPDEASVREAKFPVELEGIAQTSVGEVYAFQATSVPLAVPATQVETRLFLHPEACFLCVDEDFYEGLKRTSRAALHVQQIPIDGVHRPVALRLRAVINGKKRDIKMDQPLGGASGSLAAGVAVLALDNNIQIEPQASFTADLTESGDTVGVEGLKGKLWALKSDIGDNWRLYLHPSNKQDFIHDPADEDHLVVAATLREAFEQAIDVKKRLMDYLYAVQVYVNEMSSFDAQQRSFDRVEMNVRVHPNSGRLFDPESPRRDGTGRALSAGRDGIVISLTDGRPQETGPLGVRWDDFRRGKNHLVILGHPGSGKSTLLRKEAHQHAVALQEVLKTARQQEARPGENYIDVRTLLEKHPIPVLVGLASIAEQLPSHNDDFGQALLAAVKELPGLEHVKPPAWNLLEEVLGTKQVLLLLDALDEVENRALLLERLKTWAKRNPNAPILLTSRRASYDIEMSFPLRGQAHQVELMPFNRSQIKEFVENWFHDEQDAGRSQRLLDMLQRQPDLEAMASTPLLLLFLCLLMAREDDSEIDLTLINQAGLYRKILTKIYKLEHKKNTRFKPLDKYEKRFLIRTAFHLFTQRKQQVDEKTLNTLLQEQIVEDFLDRPDGVSNRTHAKDAAAKFAADQEKRIGLKDYAEFLIDRYARQVGILELIGHRKDDLHDPTAPGVPIYGFLHHTLQEYLAAQFLADRVNAENIGWQTPFCVHDLEDLDTAGHPLEKQVGVLHFIEKKSWLPAYRQMTLLFAGLIEQSDDMRIFLETIAAETEDTVFQDRLALACRCMKELSIIWPDAEGRAPFMEPAPHTA